MKLFIDDTSLFSTVYDPNVSARQLENDDLTKFYCLSYKWKMTFNLTYHCCIKDTMKAYFAIAIRCSKLRLCVVILRILKLHMCPFNGCSLIKLNK